MGLLTLALSGLRNLEDDEDIILSIPGPWPDFSTFGSALQESSNDRFFAEGGLILDSHTRESAKLQFRISSPELAEGFSSPLLDQASADAIAAHRSIAHLLINYRGHETFEYLLHFTRAVHEAGGIAVRIETAGVTHSWVVWQNLVSSDYYADNLKALVIHVYEDNQLSSFGMAQLHHPDAENIGAADHIDVSELLERFNLYQWLEKPVLLDGQTFSLEAGAPRFRLEFLPDERYPADDVYFNKYGVWRLTYLDG